MHLEKSPGDVECGLKGHQLKAADIQSKLKKRKREIEEGKEEGSVGGLVIINEINTVLDK